MSTTTERRAEISSECSDIGPRRAADLDLEHPGLSPPDDIERVNGDRARLSLDLDSLTRQFM